MRTKRMINRIGDIIMTIQQEIARLASIGPN